MAGLLETSGWTVAWGRDADGAILPRIEVVPLRADDLTYVVTGRVVLGELDTGWEEAPCVALGDDPIDIALGIPAAAYVSDAQTSALADLVVTVRAMRGDQLVDELPVAYARVAWPSGSDAPPTLLAQDAATQTAPGGVLGESPVTAPAEDEQPTGNAPADEVSP